MPLCSSIPATVDYETSTRASYVSDLEKSLKKFDGALTATMNSYRSLLTAFDQVAQVYGNIAGTCSDAVRKPIIEFRDGMRDLKDKGPFVTFNAEIHKGTIKSIEPLRADLKKVQKSLDDLKARQKEYDSVRYSLEKKEKDYAKKDKPLASSSQYKKDLVKRDKRKLAYETKRKAFELEVSSLQRQTETLLLGSLNSYLHCTATFCGQLEVTMSGYRTDMLSQDSAPVATKMDELKEKAEMESVSRRARWESQAAESNDNNSVQAIKVAQTDSLNDRMSGKNVDAAHDSSDAAAMEHSSNPLVTSEGGENPAYGVL